MKLNDILEKDPDLESDYSPQLDIEKNTNKNLKTDKLKKDISNLKTDVKDMQKELDDLKIELDDDIGRMSYVRQLTGEFLEYLIILNGELEKQVKIPDSIELMNKMLSRSERKRYYMSKFRL